MPLFNTENTHTIDIEDITQNLDDYAEEYNSVVLESWNFGMSVDVVEKTKQTQIFFVASHAEKGNFYFYKESGEVKGGMVTQMDDLLNIDAGSVSKSAELVFKDIGKDNINEILQELKSKITKDNAFIQEDNIYQLLGTSEDEELEVADVYAYMLKNGIDAEDKISKKRMEYNAIIKKLNQELKKSKEPIEERQENKSVASSLSSTKKAAPIQNKNSLSDREYAKFIIERNKEINLKMVEYAETMEYDPESPAETAVAEAIMTGAGRIFKGVPGSGKTAGINGVAKKNAIPIIQQNFDDATDGIDIEGGAVPDTDLLSGNPMFDYNYGVVIKAAEHASHASKVGKPTICFLDEISRGMSHGKLIGLLSVDPTYKEYAMMHSESKKLARIKAIGGEEVWFEIGKNIDAQRQKYSIDENNEVVLDEDSGFYQYSGDLKSAEERMNRKDLLMISTKDFTHLLKNNLKCILETQKGTGCAYIPEFGITFIGATNVNTNGNNGVNDLPKALLSRMPMVDIEPADIGIEVKKCLKSEAYLKQWTVKEKEEVELILTEFFKGCDNGFKAKDMELGEEVAIRLVSDTVKALPVKDPIKGERNIYTVLKDNVSERFMPHTAETEIGASNHNVAVVFAKEVATDLKKRGVSSLKQKAEAQEKIKVQMEEGASPSQNNSERVF